MSQVWSEQQLNQKAQILHALANEKRLDLVEKLRGRELSVKDLADECGITPSLASQHLKILLDSRLISDRRHGSVHAYRCPTPAVGKVLELVNSMLDELQ